MRIAVPVWENKVSPVLDTASRLLIVDIKDREAKASFETHLEDQDFPQRCLRIQGMGVDVLICGAVSRPFLRMLMASGMEIIPGVSGNPDDVLAAYLSGTIHQQEFLMPGFERNKFGQRNGFSTTKMKRRRRKKRGKIAQGG
jgi:predicted Fe-Mo cluster-binding NifX family protein